MGKDVFAETVATYRDEAGAEAFVRKELPRHEARSASVYTLLDGVELAGCRALDVGCGYGRDVAELRKRGAEAYGCDVSPALLAMAEAEVGPYFQPYDVRSGEALPFGGGFDLVWCCALLVHVPRDELAAVLARLWDGLKVGGRLAIYTKQGEGEQVVFNLGEGLPRVMVHYRLEEIASVLRGLGGEIDMADDHFATSAFGDALMLIRAIKLV